MTGFSNPIIGGGGGLVYPSIHSPNFDEATQTGWSIDKNGDAFFYGITTSGEFTGTDFIISAAGAFFYSGTPALGNLTASVARAGGTDTEGNAYLAGHTSYAHVGGVYIACSLQSGQISFQSAAVPAGPYGVDTSLNDISAANSQGTMELGGALVIEGLGNAGSLLLVENLIAATSPLAVFSGKTAADIVLASFTQGQLSPTPGFQVQANGQVQLEFGISTGEMLTIWNTSSSTGNPNVQLIGDDATDNMLGIEISTDSSNRLKVNASGLIQWGSGTSGQDARLYRASAGVLGVDTLAANVSGSAETWHSLGTLAGYTVTIGRYRLTPENEVQIEVEVTSGGSNAGTVTFANSLPAAYTPLDSRHLPLGKASTLAAGDVWPRLFISNTGGVQVVQNASNNVSLGGTYRIPLD